MSFWLYLIIGLAIGAAPALLAPARLRPWWARRWCQTTLALAITLFVIPIAIVLVLFLVDSAWEAIAKLWDLFRNDFRGMSGIVLGWLAGSAAPAWQYRHAPYLEGPPLPEQVKALARDPDRHAKALQVYRRETGADMAVAIDAIEQFSRRPEGVAKRQPAGPLEWMYFGFAAPWYAILAAAYVLTFSSAGNPILAALGFFVFVPALFAGFCGICGSAVTAQTKAALAHGWEQRRMTRGYAFSAGAIAGLASIVATFAGVVALYPFRHAEAGLWIGLVWVGSVLIAAPFFGLWLLRKRITERNGA
jgi:hypothetical protein